MTEQRFNQWLLLVCKKYIEAIRDGTAGEFKRRSIHIILGRACVINREEIDYIFHNLDKEICLELDKLDDPKNVNIYAQAMYDRLTRDMTDFESEMGHKWIINNIY